MMYLDNKLLIDLQTKLASLTSVIVAFLPTPRESRIADTAKQLSLTQISFNGLVASAFVMLRLNDVPIK
jgi:hypothetical protein